MRQATVEKYLGFQLANSASASVAATVAKRYNVALRAIYEARAVVEDTRAECLGGLVIMFDIWSLGICPALYYGCETWSPLPGKTLKSLNRLTITYLRVALGLGKKGGCPLPSMFWQTGTYLPEMYILKQKLLFIGHLARLPVCSKLGSKIDRTFNREYVLFYVLFHVLFHVLFLRGIF